ncbi:MAG: FkbM family methyltransferase [Halieaceae bacterium]|nr:FkbM family methyltransferase [Halieaceae bacterium]
MDKFLLDNYFPDVVGGTFLECGAFDGVVESCCKFFEEFRGWRGVNVEPVPYLYERLCKNRPHANNINVALTDEARAKLGPSVFHQAIHPVIGRNFGNGSLSHTGAHIRDLKARGCSFEEIRVPTMTYTQLIHHCQLTKLDLFVLDVEGHELSVLSGMRSCDVLPEVFCVERGHVREELYAAVESLGYKFDATSHNNSFFLRSGSR